MAISTDKRKKMENVIYKTFDLLDKTGKNTQKYKDKFKAMSNEQFDKFFKNFFADDSSNFYLEAIPYVNEPILNDVYDAANFLKVPIYEHVCLPFENPNGEPVVTREAVPVIYIHMKRVQQTVAKKNSTSIHIEQVNPKSGQVSGKDKNSRSSDVENISLVALECDNILKEMNGPKADDQRAKNEMLKRIKNDGYVSLKDLPSNKSDKVALNTLDVFFTCCGLKTNLITDGLLLPRTYNNLNKDVNSIASNYMK